MTEPSRERIAAALALAKAADTWYGLEATEEQPGWCEESKAMFRAMQAYRATAHKPRTRAEVDAEIAKLTRECVENEWAGDDDYELWEAVTKLCREPTAREPASQQPFTCTDCGAAIGARERCKFCLMQAPGAAPAPAPVERATGNPLVRIQWQCSSCGWGFFGPLQQTCPGCGADHYWCGSVAPDCKPWPGYPCAPAPGVVAAPLERIKTAPEPAPNTSSQHSDPLHPTGRCTCGGEGRCDWCKAHPDPEDCPECAASRDRLRDVYHMTLTYGGDPQAALVAIRKATMPGASGNGA